MRIIMHYFIVGNIAKKLHTSYFAEYMIFLHSFFFHNFFREKNLTNVRKWFII